MFGRELSGLQAIQLEKQAGGLAVFFFQKLVSCGLLCDMDLVVGGRFVATEVASALALP